MLTKKPEEVGPPDFSKQPYMGVDGHPHIFHNRVNGKYTFSDETQCLNDREYDSVELAEQGLRDYCAFSLEGPFLLKEIENILDGMPSLKVYTSVHVAKQLFAQCRGEDAILTLRADLPKLKVHSERLYMLVKNNPQVTPLIDSGFGEAPAK